MHDRLELIQSRIKNIKDPIQKALLRDVLYDVVNEMFQHTEEKFEAFQRKIDGELQDNYENYYVYMALCKNEDIDETSRFLFEMPPLVGLADEDILGTIFLERDYRTVASCLNRTFRAVVTTDKDVYDIEVELKYSRGYLSRVEWLYEQFQANKKQWQTINCSFVYKFLDMVDVENKIPKTEKIVRCEIDMLDLNPFIRADISLLWNIQITNVISEGKVITVPGINSILHEHRLKAQLELYAYMVEDEDMIHDVHIYTENEFIVRAKEKVYEFTLLRFANIEFDKDSTKLFMPLQTNRRIMKYTDKLANQQHIPILTRGEIERLFNQYTAYENLELKNISIRDEYADSYLDLNHFIKSGQFLLDRKILLLTFESKSKEDILLHEKMHFLVSGLQLYFKEYQCIGEIV